ncbi:MAG: DUF302 domain-containing protein [Bdellovibrionales bacterium]|nr:DUF302 domain-containing protein [Bdellovibrionales bacterium]MBT3526886.1 DUF302 domain-containing protein [Bdellovibrionales bacterium]MBT7668709.1 DUF302 domain-containing protein [Bdellovibrionales bacterium]MBT7765743.1 DUF302 domain-containing protein [Bdellovibrionales bacterium]
MSGLNFKKEFDLNFDDAVVKISAALKERGFSILTTIDFSGKMKEKLDKDIPQLVILGACNPHLAFEAYSMNSDVTSLMPCNAVVRQLVPGRVSIELIKPTKMMEMVGDDHLVQLAQEADQILSDALNGLSH